MGILLRNKLKRRRNAVVYTTVFTVAAIVFTVSTFATHNKTEYVHENETSYAVDISGIDIDKLEAAREEVEEIIPVFRACTQCRADAYGIPGKKSEDHHLGMTPQSHY